MHNVQVFPDATSDRLIEQRVRNRIMEAIWELSLGDEGLAQSGPTEWFESFFDWFPYEGEPDYYPAMIADEVSAVGDVVKLMQQAVSDTDISNMPTIKEITDTRWPARIAPVAKHALDVMLRRGRFSEDVEEVDPTSPIPWPPE